MDTSLFIVKILGPCFLVVALGIMLNRGFFQKVMEDFCKNSALMFFGGMFALVVGLVVVLNHNVWVRGWPVVITIYGWGGILKGIWMLVFPNSAAKFTQAYSKNKTFLLAHSIVILVLGVALIIFGYF